MSVCRSVINYCERHVNCLFNAAAVSSTSCQLHQQSIVSF